MRHLGIDYGTRRVGLALSDEGARLATPLEVVRVTSPAQALERAAAVAVAEGVGVVVIGLPLNMDGTDGPAAAEVRRWAAELAPRVRGAGIVFVDERLSSFEAGQSLAERRRQGERLTRGGKKRRLDAVAAAQLLQSYLDGTLPPLVDAG